MACYRLDTNVTISSSVYFIYVLDAVYFIFIYLLFMELYNTSLEYPTSYNFPFNFDRRYCKTDKECLDNGNCVDHKCECYREYYGTHCQFAWKDDHTWWTEFLVYHYNCASETYNEAISTLQLHSKLL
jgi:hypothetical protein